MRVGVVTNIVSPYRTPVWERLAARPGCELLVVFETEMEPNRHWDAGGELAFPHAVLRSTTLDLRRLAPDAFLHVPHRPLAALRRFGADAVVAAGGGSWSSPTNVAALAARPRRGWAVVPSWESHEQRQPPRARRLAEPWVRAYMRAGDAWLAWGSRATRDVVRLGADPARTVTVPQVALAPPPGRGDTGEPAGEGARILFVGQLLERKGVRVLLEAMRDVPGAELWLAGDGPLRPEVEAAAAADPRIRYHGHLDAAALGRLYAHATALVLPSLYEVWGLVVNEALEHGLPVVVADGVGAADDLVEEGVTGRVVPAGDARALAAALRDVAAWGDERREAGRRRAAELLSAYTFDAVAAGIEEACRLGVEARAARGRP